MEQTNNSELILGGRDRMCIVGTSYATLLIDWHTFLFTTPTKY